MYILNTKPQKLILNLYLDLGLHSGLGVLLGIDTTAETEDFVSETNF